MPVVSWRLLAQRDTSACLAPGASFSSLHEWLRKAVTSPITAGSVRAWSGVATFKLLSRSAACSRLAGRQRSSFVARSSAAPGALPPTSAATAAALERAAKLLRCLPASRLHAADLANGKTAAPPAEGPTLHARTVPAAMGQVTAFLSHSWSDEREAPGAKHALVSRWAKRRQETTGVEPTLWLVALERVELAPSLHTPRVHRARPFFHTYRSHITQDKACIDQNNIEQSLACWPVFLAGCQTLLVVAGPTYCSRLWCAMELFTFTLSRRLLFEPC